MDAGQSGEVNAGQTDGATAAPDVSPSLRTLAMPADTNPSGDIFGGWIMAQMDLAGGTYASHLARGRVATVAITGMQFLRPVYVGDEISCYCRTVRLGNTSITVEIETWARRREPGQAIKVTEGNFTFVALDANGRPRPVLRADDATDS